MSTLEMRWTDASGIDQLAEAARILSGRQRRQADARALNRAGDMARTQTKRALAGQTGLTVGYVGQRLLRGTVRASGNRPVYRISAKGGEIPLKFFKARETRRGVSAAPFGKRRVFAGSFIKGGRFPNRVDIGMNQHVYERAGKSRQPIKRVKSGVVFPGEMVKDQSAEAWRRVVADVLPRRIVHEYRQLTKRVFG